MSESSEAKTLARADQAQRLLNDPLLTEAYALVRQSILSKIEQSPVRDSDGREYLYLMLKATKDARALLEQAVNDGKVVVHLQSERRRFKLFG